MSLRRLLRILEGGSLALLVAAHVLFWLHFPRLSAGWPAEAGLVRDAVLSAQATLLVGIIVVGPGSWWLRQPVALSFAAAIIAFHLIDHPRDLRWGEMLLAIEASAVGLSLLVQFALGWRLIRWEQVENGPGFQFSLHALLATVFVVALGLGTGQWLRASIGEHGVSKDWIVTLVAVSFALPAFLAWPAVLSARSPWLRIAALLATTPAFALIVPYLTSAADQIRPLVMWASLQTLLVSISLVVLRSAGYRWVKARRPMRRRSLEVPRRSIGAERLRREFVEALKSMEELSAEAQQQQGI
jgi:hypothetical protein